jgi:hypothetical protein
MFSWLRGAAKPTPAPSTAAGSRTPSSEAEPVTANAPDAEDALREVPGMTASMLVVLGENGIKTLEDLAGCAADDLYGWVEPVGDTSISHPGVLEGFGLSREECGAMIIKARVKAGWIDEAAPQQTKQV